jgi:hypothetical protein
LKTNLGIFLLIFVSLESVEKLEKVFKKFGEFFWRRGIKEPKNAYAVCRN